MSGGSYCYLMLADDANDLASKRVQLEEMHERLAGLGYAPKATATTGALLEALRLLDDELPDNPIRDVWKAVEWHDSSDWGEDDMREAIEKYENSQPCPPGGAS